MLTVKHNVRTRKRKIPLLIVCILLLLLLDVTWAIKWLGLYRERNIAWNQTKTCKKLKDQYGLTGEQTKICKKFADAMPHVQEAAILSIATCQNFFRHRQWNCSTIKYLPNLLPDLSTGTRERAFVHALSAAALTYTVARGCASAAINSCSCASHPEDPPNGNFKWGGCGDNVHYAAKFSRDFVDARKKGSADKQRKLNKTAYYNYRPNGAAGRNRKDEANNDVVVEYNKGLNKQIRMHNGDKGRTLVSESLVTHCKCHGVSGSCSIKTCWRGLPLKFHEIGEKLMTSYVTATQVHPLTRADHLMYRFSDSHSLLYAAASPNYCEYNPKGGTFGTSGRECNVSANAPENCESMCCGRGYKSWVVEQTEKCNCKYHWCCYVTCDSCKIKRNVSICN